MKGILKRFDISARQYLTLSLLVFHSFFSAIFVSIFFSVANIEFVKNFGKESLPVGYLLSGIVGYIAINGYGKLLKRNGKIAFLGALLFMLISAVIFRLAYYFITPNSEGTKYLSLILYLFATPFIYISSIQQSGLLLKIYNIQEGKKYTGIISSAGTLAYIIGYLSVPTCILFLKTNQNLLFIAILGILIAIYYVLKINKKLINNDPKSSFSNKSINENDITLKNLLSQKFIRYIAICGGISTIAYYFIDYSFLINVQDNSKKGNIDLTEFMGFFLTAVKIAELILGLSSSKFFRNFGLKAGIIILPLLCLFFIICIILLKWIPSTDLFLLSVIIWSMKFFERIFKKSIEEPTFKNLYQIFDTNERLAILNKIEGGTKQLSVIIGSAVLLFFGSFVVNDNLELWLLYLSLPLFSYWVYSAYQLIGSYKIRLKDELKSKHIADNSQKSVWNKFSILFNHQNNLLKTKNNLFSILGIKIPQNNLVPILISNPQNSLREEIQFDEPILIIPPKVQPVFESKTSSKINVDENDLFLLALAIEQPSINMLKLLDKKLNEVQNNYEKRLILNILERSDEPYTTSILLKNLNYPDYYIKKQVYKVLEIKKYKYAANEEIYFWNSLETTLSELTFLISMLNSIPQKDIFSDLIKAIIEEKHISENRLLSILTWKYDNSAIKVIRENIFSDYISSNQNDNILALELMDNLLDNSIKEKIMTAFSNANSIQKLASLNKWYYHSTKNLREALISILNYDYTKIGIWIKACALSVINNHNSSNYKKIVAGFNYHPNSLLRLLAHQFNTLVHGEPLPFLKGKQELMLISKVRKSKSTINGEELFNLVKVIKEISIFNNTATNDLIMLCSSAEAKNCDDTLELKLNGDHKSNPIILINGKITVEYNSDFNLNWTSNDYLSPNMFGTKGIYKITLQPGFTAYELSPILLANLIITSDSVLNRLIYVDSQEVN